MAVRLEQNPVLQTQLTKIAPQKTSVPLPKRTSDDQQNPAATAIDTYFGKEKDADELKRKSAVFADPQQRRTFGYFSSPYYSGRRRFNPATDITQLDIQKILVDAKEPSLELNKPDSAEHIDTSIKEQPDTINRDEHSELIRNSVQDRADWREGEPDKTQPGKIYDLSFDNLLDLIGQENLDKIRNTHVLKNGVPTENKCDTLIQTLEDIGKLTEENIAEMETSPVTKEALILIRNELVNSAGEYDQQKARDFEKRIMNYPPNKEHYINGMLDYSKWLGEIKVGFKVINGELVIVQNSMELTTMPGDDQLKLVFSTIDHDINGNEKVTKYSVIYDITDKYHNEENPRLIIEPLPNPEIQRKDGETIIHYLLDNHLVSVGAMQTELGKVRVAQYLSIPQSEGAGVYLNRLELFARMGVHDILKFTNDINPQELVQFEDSGKQFTYGYDEEMQEDIMLNGKQLSGWTYTISIDSGPAFNVFLSKTEKDNDIPYVCLGTKSDLELMGLPVRTSKLLTSDTNDNIWIRASKTNQNEAYKVYDNKGFWRKFNF